MNNGNIPNNNQPMQPMNPQQLNPNMQQPVQPMQQPVQPMQQPVQPMQQPVQPTDINKMAAVSNLNKEEAMEEALSHTNQYNPFEANNEQVKNKGIKSSKQAWIFVGIIAVLMALFILFLPQISKLFGW
ncbi:MAG: hypothetical protein RSB71_03480 [Bacilli bacterium]